MINQRSLKDGAVAEHVAWNFLTTLNNCTDIVDVRGDERFRAFDVDFLAQFDKSNYSWIEVKCDSKAHATGNIVWEEYSSYSSKTVGCFRKTKADIILYYLSESKEMYVFNTETLRKFVDMNADKLNLVPMGDNAMGYLIPIEVLRKCNVVCRYYEDIY